MDTENFIRLRDHRTEFDVGELVVGLRPLGCLPQRLDAACSERCGEVGLPDFIIQRDHAVAAHRAEQVSAAGGKTQKLHGSTPYLTGHS